MALVWHYIAEASLQCCIYQRVLSKLCSYIQARHEREYVVASADLDLDLDLDLVEYYCNSSDGYHALTVHAVSSVFILSLARRRRGTI